MEIKGTIMLLEAKVDHPAWDVFNVPWRCKISLEKGRGACIELTEDGAPVSGFVTTEVKGVSVREYNIRFRTTNSLYEVIPDRS